MLQTQRWSSQQPSAQSAEWTCWLLFLQNIKPVPVEESSQASSLQRVESFPTSPHEYTTQLQFPHSIWCVLCTSTRPPPSLTLYVTFYQSGSSTLSFSPQYQPISSLSRPGYALFITRAGVRVTLRHICNINTTWVSGSSTGVRAVHCGYIYYPVRTIRGHRAFPVHSTEFMFSWLLFSEHKKENQPFSSCLLLSFLNLLHRSTRSAQALCSFDLTGLCKDRKDE